MKKINNWGTSLYGDCDDEGNARRDWRHLAGDELLSYLFETALELKYRCSDVESTDEDGPRTGMDNDDSDVVKIGGKTIRMVDLPDLPLSRLEKDLSNKKASKKFLNALEEQMSLSDDDTRRELKDRLLHQANLLDSCFWRARPRVTRDRSDRTKRLYPKVVSMQRNPCCFWPCIDSLSAVHVDPAAASEAMGGAGGLSASIEGGGAGGMSPAEGSVGSSPSALPSPVPASTGRVCVNQRNETGVACHCDNHRLHNTLKRVLQSCDPDFMDNTHSIATAMHNPLVAPRVKANIQLLLKPEGNTLSDYHQLVSQGIRSQNEKGEGVSLQEIVDGCDGSPDRSVLASNPCRWGSGLGVCADVATRGDLLGAGILRQKSVGKTDEAEIAGAVAIFSSRGWISGDHQDLVLDKERAGLFLSLVNPQAREQRYLAAFLYDILYHPISAVISNDGLSSTMMKGMGGAPRQLLYVITELIWLSTGPREHDADIGCRTDHSKVRFEPFSLRLLNPACGPAVRKYLREEWSETYGAILDKIVGAVPLLLKRFRRIAMMEGRVLPDTTRRIFQAIPGHGRLYHSDGKLMDPPSLTDPPDVRRPSKEMQETFAIKMAQLQFHVRIVILDALHEMRDSFHREMLGATAIAAGMTAEQWSHGTVNGKQILHASPWALANAAVMRVMGRDTLSSLRKQIDRNPLDFLPPFGWLWGPDGTRSTSSFGGMARGGDFEYDDTDATVAPRGLEGLAIARDDSGDHFKTVVSLGAKGESGEPIRQVLSRTRELNQFPKPLSHFPYAHQLCVRARVSATSSKNIEQPWAETGQQSDTRQGATWEYLSGVFTGRNDDGMGIDILQLVKDKPVLFRAGLEVARLPGWIRLFQTDIVGRDAIYADLKFDKAANSGKAFWDARNHDRSHRSDRWLNPTQAEQKAEANHIQRTRKRLGYPALPMAKAIRKAKATVATAVPARRRRQGGSDGEEEADPSAAAAAAASSAAASSADGIRTRAAARAAAQPTPQIAAGGGGCTETLDGRSEEIHSDIVMDDAFEAPELADEEMAETATGGDELTHLAPVSPPDIAAHGSVSQQVEGRRASDVDSLEKNDAGEHGAEKCTKGSSDGSDSESDDIPIQGRPAFFAARIGGAVTDGSGTNADESGVRLLPAAVGLDGRDGGGSGDSDKGDEEDDSESDSDSDDRFVILDVDGNKWSIEYLYNIFQGLSYGIGWSPSKVNFNKVGGLTAHVTRMPTARLKRYLAEIKHVADPKASFPVYPASGTLLYARKCDYGGVQVVRVTTLAEPCENDWSKTMHFRRYFSTYQALQHCEAAKDDGPAFGKKSLRKFWNLRGAKQDDYVYHEGDCVFNGDVRELIGVARWYPVDKGQPERGYFTECSTADLVFVGPPFRLKLVEDEG